MRVVAVVIATALVVGVGCGREGNDAADVQSASATGSSPEAAPSSESQPPSDFRGGVDGPVMFAPGPSTDGGEDALIEGVLVRDGDCLFVGTAEPGDRFAALWPFGTSWDDDAEAVVTSGGDVIPVGSIVSAGGGYPYAEKVQQLSATDAFVDRVEHCAEGQFRELAHIQHTITVQATTASEPRVDDVEASDGWVQAPEPPIAARTWAVVADLDGTIIVVGGWDFLCPPGADCAIDADSITRFSDGAAFDPQTGEWTAISDAPIEFVSSRWTTSGPELYAPAGCIGGPNCDDGPVILRYRSADDAWDTLPAPNGLPAPNLATLADGTVVAFAGSDEQGESADYILVGDRWEPLPDDPLPPVYDRFVLGDERRVFVFGSPIDGDDGFKLGAVFDRDAETWSEVATAPGTGYQVWPGGDDGFYLNPHFGPSVEGGVYDPSLDTWIGFPEPPQSRSWRNDMAGVVRSRDATYEYSSGWVRDTTSDQWIEIPDRPRASSEGQSLTNSARSLVVYGGQDWTGDDGQLLNEMWIWTPPSEQTETVDLASATVPCDGEREFASFDYAEGEQGAETIKEAVDGWTFQGGAPYLRAELDSLSDASTGQAALIDSDGNVRILLAVRETADGWFVDSSERCLDP